MANKSNDIQKVVNQKLKYQRHQKKVNNIKKATTAGIAALCMLLLGCGIYHNFNQPGTAKQSPAYKNVTSSSNQPKLHQDKEPNKVTLVKHTKSMPKMKLARSAIAMDAKTGNILYQKNPNQPRKVASVAKIMTLYLVEQKLNKNPQDWNKPVKAAHNKYLRKMSYSQKLGGFKFKKNHTYTVKQLFKAALIESSNNSAIALGKYVAGSNAKFVNMMNVQAQIWGIKAHFVSPCGLENDDLIKYHQNVVSDPKAANKLSAKAVAIIAQHLINEYPNITKWSKLPSTSVDGQILENANGLVPGGRFPQLGTHVNGLKTGFTPKAGFCFVSTSTHKHEHKLIVVSLHDENEFTDVRNMINYIDNNSKEIKK